MSESEQISVSTAGKRIGLIMSLIAALFGFAVLFGFVE